MNSHRKDDCENLLSLSFKNRATMQDISLETIPYSKIKEIDFSIFPWLELDYIEVEEGVMLRVYKIPCKNPSSRVNIVVIAGLVSHFLGWIDLNHELSKIGTIYHVETREKNSAKFYKKNIDYSMDTYADDINKVINKYKLDKDGYYIFGDSFGSEIAIKFLDKGYTSPKGLILISPTETFAFSGWMKILFRFAPYWLYYPLLPFLLFVLKYFRTNLKSDRGTYYLNRRNMITSKPKRMKKCALHMFSYASEVDYSRIKCPTYIFAASNDKMHSYQESVDIAEKIPNSIFENLVNYHLTHNRETAAKTINFILEIEKESTS